MAKINLASFERQLAGLRHAFDTLPQAALDEFKANTPIRTGNARRNTVLQGNSIVADYAYGQRLDEGWSKQAPQGMTAPTLKWIQQEVDQRLKGI